MVKREKRLKKQEESLLKQAEKHMIKIKTQSGRKDTTPAYWLGEVERFKEQAKQRAEMFKKIKRKKRI